MGKLIDPDKCGHRHRRYEDIYSDGAGGQYMTPICIDCGTKLSRTHLATTRRPDRVEPIECGHHNKRPEGGSSDGRGGLYITVVCNDCGKNLGEQHLSVTTNDVKRKPITMKRKALITGIHGQDGSYLADLLLSKGYEVWGMQRRTSNSIHPNTKHLEGKINYVNGDLTDQTSLVGALRISNPDEVYNLGAQSFVGESWNTPAQTTDVTGVGVLRMLEAIRTVNKDIKFYVAGSSEMFGKQTVKIANEDTPFYPRSPYGCAKLYGHWITKNYRESYGMFCCNGILFNHEGPRRHHDFVTRKITDGVARIKLGLADHITLGNLDAKRDWGYAPDFVEAMWLMMQHETPDDYVIATGTAYSIRDFIAMAFKCFGIDNWSNYIKTDPKYMRPAEVDYLCGDASKAKEVLGWVPKTDIQDWVCRMVNNDLNLLSNG